MGVRGVGVREVGVRGNRNRTAWARLLTLTASAFGLDDFTCAWLLPLRSVNHLSIH